MDPWFRFLVRCWRAVRRRTGAQAAHWHRSDPRCCPFKFDRVQPGSLVGILINDHFKFSSFHYPDGPDHPSQWWLPLPTPRPLCRRPPEMLVSSCHSSGWWLRYSTVEHLRTSGEYYHYKAKVSMNMAAAKLANLSTVNHEHRLRRTSSVCKTDKKRELQKIKWNWNSKLEWAETYIWHPISSCNFRERKLCNANLSIWQ